MKRNPSQKRTVGSNIYTALVYLFLYLPIFVMIAFSFNESKSRANFTGFTLNWYAELFHNDLIITSFWNSIFVAVISTLIATVIGTLAAIGISNMRKFPRSVVMNVTYIPVINPDIVTGVSLCLCFAWLVSLIGIGFGFTTVLIAHISFEIPYIILNVLPKLRQMDKNIYEAALDLGCSPAQAYRKVVLPEVAPGILAGALMAFTYSLDDFIVTYFVSGSGFQTLPVTIYGMVKKKVNPQINAISTLLFIVTLTILILSNVMKNRRAADKRVSPIARRVIAGALAVVIIFVGVFAYLGGNTSGKQKIYVYNWGEYMPDGSDESLDVIAAFEEAYPEYDVVYDTFTSNEALYAKMKNGTITYDVIVPSDYMIARMIEEDMLMELNFENIPNFSKVMDNFIEPEYDPENKYSVPYLWGTVGLVYNTNAFDEAPTSWGVLWDEAYAGQILMFNNYRDAFGIAQKYLGYSQNTTSEEELRACTDKLIEQKPLVQAYVMDEIFDKMENGEAMVAPYYAGDVLTMMDDNEDLAFAAPEEGTNWFVDAMCIPKNAQNKEGAELFINFILETEISLEITDFVGYATPNREAYEQLDDEVKEDPQQYPTEEMLAKDDVFKNLPPETNQLMSELWIEIKTDE